MVNKNLILYTLIEALSDSQRTNFKAPLQFNLILFDIVILLIIFLTDLK